MHDEQTDQESRPNICERGVELSSEGSDAVRKRGEGGECGSAEVDVT